LQRLEGTTEDDGHEGVEQLKSTTLFQNLYLTDQQILGFAAQSNHPLAAAAQEPF
jgi:hypothetical protein